MLGLVGVLLVGGCVTRTTRVNTMNVESDLPALVIFTNAAAWASAAVGPTSGERVLESPPIRTVRNWNELVVSWNVEPAAGAGLEVEAQAQLGDRWTRWYRLGDWSLDGATPVRRTSVPGESDGDGVVKTDTLVIRGVAGGLRLRLKLSGTLAEAPDRLRWVALALCDSNQLVEPRAARLDVRGLTLDVPERSQVAYPEGGGWCSPTSVSMLLAWWSQRLGRPELDLDVPRVAAGVHDPGWPGTGNWPFNTAYAGSFPGMRGCVARLRDLRDVEDLVAAGIPVVLSVNAPALRGKPMTPDGGHLVICVGFTVDGDLVVNDPWARLEEGQRVRKVVSRGNAERAWEHAHRMAYLVAPVEMAEAFPAVWR